MSHATHMNASCHTYGCHRDDEIFKTMEISAVVIILSPISSVCDGTSQCFIIYVCDMTQSCVRHDPFCRGYEHFVIPMALGAVTDGGKL